MNDPFSDPKQRAMALEACAKSGQIGAYRTAALTIRGMVERFGEPTAEQWEIVAKGFEEKANQLNNEVLAVIPPAVLVQQ